MSKRFTDTTKWTDKWFRKLSVHEKLLFLWLVDNCDNAGFWEVDLELAAQQIGITEAETTGAWQGLCRAYSTQGEYVWIKRFIRVQGNCPLNPDNNAHKQILSLFQEHADFGIDFESALRNDFKSSPSLGPKEPPCNGRGRSNGNGNSKSKRARGNFAPPTLQEIQQLIQERGYSVDPNQFLNFYESKGWMVGKNKMKDWRSALAGWESRDKKAAQLSTADKLAEYENQTQEMLNG